MTYRRDPYGPDPQWLAIRRSIADFARDPSNIQGAIDDIRTYLHGGSHHMSGFNGAFKCTAGKDTYNPTAKPRSSYLTCDDDRLVETIRSTMLAGRDHRGRSNINTLAGFLNNADVGNTYALTVEVPPGDDPFGKTLRHETESPNGSDRRLRETEARQLKVVFKKTDPQGGFILYNIYPDPTEQDKIQTETPRTELSQKMRRSQTYQDMSATEKVFWLAQTRLDDRSPDMELRGSGTNAEIVLHTRRGGRAEIGVGENGLWAKRNGQAAVTGEEALREANRLRLRGTVDRLRREITDLAGSTRDLSPVPSNNRPNETQPQSRLDAPDAP